MSEGKDDEAGGPGDTERKAFSRSNSRTAKSEAFEFDVALAYSQSDEEVADRVKEELQELVLQDGSKARVCLFDAPRFGPSITDRPSILLTRCSFVFLLMSNNTKDDRNFIFLKKELVGHTQLETSEQDRVRVLHTEPERDRHYDPPAGLLDTQSLAWHQPLDKSKSEMVQFLSYNRKIKTSGQTSNGQKKEKEMTIQARKLRDDSKCVLKNCQKEMYFPTYATRVSMDTLKLKGSLLISGRSGDGKTATVYHILTELMKTNPAFQPFIVSKPEDLDHIPLQDSIIFIDNIFGVSNFSSVLLEQWKLRFPTLEAHVEEGSMYFIATSSCHVLANCSQQINNLSLLANRVDMVEEFSLSSDEKDGMLRRFLEWKKIYMTDKQIQQAVKSRLSLGFPQCCKLYVTNTEAQKLGALFFEKPSFLNEQISKFETSEVEIDRVSYQLLLFCVFEKGQFSTESLKVSADSVPISPTSPTSSCSSSSMSSSSSWSILNNICSVTNCTPEMKRLAVKNLVKMGFFRYNQQAGLYEFSHQSIYDAVCVSIGRKDHVKDVIERAPVAFLVNNTSVTYVGPERAEHMHVIFIPQAQRPILVDRILFELKQGNVQILEHNIFCEAMAVNEMFKRQDFVDDLTNIFKDHQYVVRLWELNFLYLLTAANEYQTLILQMISILQKIPKEVAEISEEIHFDVLPVDDVHESLLHQCFEGACNSGDIRIFQRLKKQIKPCNRCFLKAIESQVDRPQIFKELLSQTTDFHIDVTHVIRDLVKKEKLECLEMVLKSDRLSTDSLVCARLVLFKEACLSGNYELFDNLKKTIGFPEDRQNELLFAAVRGGGIRILQEIITEKNKNCLDERGRTLLHLACEREQSNSFAFVDFLIEYGVNTSVLDKIGRSVLHLVCKYKDLEFLKKMINQGVEVTVTNSDQNKFSPLHMAAQNVKEGPSLVDILLERGPKDIDMINYQDCHGRTPLHIAAQTPHGCKMIAKLLEKKADQSIRDDQGKTALHKAAEFDLVLNMNPLLKNGCDLLNSVDVNKKTPLHLLLSRYERRDGRKSQTVEMILKAGAALHLADNDGNTVLHVAAERNTGVQVLTQLLEKFSGDVGLNNKGLSPLHCLLRRNACRGSVDSLVAKFPYLLKTPTKDGRSVLHVALEKRSPYQIIEYLLKKLVKLEAVKWDDLDVRVIFRHFTDEELTQFISSCAYYLPPSVNFAVYQYICKRQFPDDKHWQEICDLLDVQRAPGHSTLIFDVLQHPDRIEYLVEKNMSVNTVNTQGMTPLHASVYIPNNKSTLTLIKAGADVNKRDNNGSIPLHCVTKVNYLFALFNSSVMHNHKVLRLLFPENEAMSNVTKSFRAILETISNLLKPIDAIRLASYSQVQTDVQLTISMLTDKKSNVNTHDSKGLTPVHLSVFDEKILSKLVAAGGDVNLTTHDGWSCLHMACLVNNKNVVRYLLECGLSPFKGDTNGITPFQVAVITADEDLILEMLSHSDKYQPQKHDLHLAAACSSKVVLEKIIEPNMLFSKNECGHLPLFYAVLRGQLDIVEMLLQAMRQTRMKPDQTSGLSEISEPVSAGQEDVYGEENKTPTLKTLLEMNGNVDTQTLLHIASKYHCPEMLKRLVKEGFHVNSCDENRRTPLHVSVMKHNSDNVEHLLKEETEVDCVDNRGMTPLMYSCNSVSPSLEVVSGLIRKGASVKTRSLTQRTAMHFLVSHRRPLSPEGNYVCSDPSTVEALKVFRLLIEQGADVNAKDQQGLTPLHLAAVADNCWFVSILLDYGADIDALDDQGFCPLRFTLEGYQSYISRYLVERGARLDLLDQSARSKIVKTVIGTLSGSVSLKRKWPENV